MFLEERMVRICVCVGVGGELVLATSSLVSPGNTLFLVALWLKLTAASGDRVV